MRGIGLAAGRALSACVIGGLALTLAGCGPAGTSATSTSSVTGNTLRIYVSAPPVSATDSRTRDVLDAERLAFQQAGSNVGRYRLELSIVRNAKLSDNARAAIRDSSAIAYVGEIVPGQSADSAGIVGAPTLLQVSPTDNAIELTRGSGAVPGSPGDYYETKLSNGNRTFARVVPASELEAKALVSELHALHVSKVFLTDDGDHYGAALADAVKQSAASTLTVTQGAPTAAAFTSSGAGALLYATSDKAKAAALFDAVAAGDPSVKLLAASALDDAGFVSGRSPAAQRNLYISAPGFLPADLTVSGRRFTVAFQSAYHRLPAPEAIFGYAAISALIDTLKRAGTNAGNRSTVIKDFFAIKSRASVLGTYSIDAYGDTNLAPFVISRVSSGRFTPYRFVNEQG